MIDAKEKVYSAIEDELHQLKRDKIYLVEKIGNLKLIKKGKPSDSDQELKKLKNEFKDLKQQY